MSIGGLRITFKRLNGTAGGEELMELGEKNSQVRESQLSYINVIRKLSLKSIGLTLKEKFGRVCCLRDSKVASLK